MVSDDPQHIFTVAARSLKDCADLLKTIKTAIEQEEQQERESFLVLSSTTPSSSSSSLSSVQPPTTFSNICRRSELYTKPSLLACQGTIGKHVRHLHDHFRLLLSNYPPCKGLSIKHEWTVDYDQRSREVPMEADINFAINELESTQHLLENCNSHPQQVAMTTDLEQPLTLQATVDPNHPTVSFQSTFGRELWFCTLHAVHHFAMIKVICGEFGMVLTDDFGLAPSTKKSRMAT